MKKSWNSILASCILVGILTVAMTSKAQGQSDSLAIGLTLPNEGETFYAGPSSLLYNIPIEGWVKSELFSPTQIPVEIAIYQNTSLVNTITIFPDSMGEFRIYATVNPGAYAENFAAEYIPCGDVCHVHPSDQFSRDEWNASLDLPAGPMHLVVTASDPDGRIANIKRNITVDRSTYAIVPVQVVLVDDGQHPVENIPITGATWLYLWRSRFATGGTDANGMALIKVEALAQAPTSYRFQVLPSVIDGVLYESIAPVEVVLAPGSSESPPVILQVRTKLGTIHGQVNGNIPLSQVQIWLVQVSDGDAQTTQLSPNGSFIFENIPISEYVVTTDPDILATLGFQMASERIDLSLNLSPMIKLNPVPLAGYSCQGTVMDSVGNGLPFAWVSIEKLDRVVGVVPDSGNFSLFGLPAKKVALMANAPGYYSQAQVINPASEDCAGFDFRLVRRPDTRSLTWGDGEIVVSPETHISLSGQHLFMERGWLWGQNNEDSPITLQSGSTEISISSGIFALEDVPGQPTWFYLFDGNGTININDGAKIISIQAGHMVVLNDNSSISVTPYNPIVVKTFHINEQLPISTILQPTLKAQLSNRLAMIGINLAKLVTFITYMLILLSVIFIPGLAFIHWQRQKKKIIKQTRYIS